MTIVQAAEFLDVPRSFILKIAKLGELRCRAVGHDRRIPLEALLEYREKMFLAAQKAADEMSQMSQDAGLYEPQANGKAP